MSLRSLGLALAALLAAPAVPAAELMVAAAVSLRDPLTEIARAYEAEHPETTVRIGFGASSLLAVQVRAGAPIDVFVSADETIVARLDAAGLVEPGEHFTLASNRLVVVARHDAGFALERAEQLAGPRVRRLAVPNGAVPVGRYAREWLASRGLLEALEPRIVLTEHARATLAAVDLGHADAAVVYATDARLARFARVAFEVPADQQPRIVYAAARIRGTSECAAEFLRFLRGPTARAALQAAGFAAP
jgi:molybdate transport system substrate-binding protein